MTIINKFRLYSRNLQCILQLIKNINLIWKKNAEKLTK